jgi:hypothetical protein
LAPSNDRTDALELVGVEQTGVDGSQRLTADTVVMRRAAADSAVMELDATVVPSVDDRRAGRADDSTSSGS